MLIGGAVRPGGIAGVPVHREEITFLGGLLRTELAIFHQVFHVQTDGDEGALVRCADRRDHPSQPIPGG